MRGIDIRQMKSTPHVVILIALAAGLLYAAAPAAAAPPPPVFVTSKPLGAVVVLDGKTIMKRTPLLLRDLRPGNHRIEIAVRGYAPYLGSFQVQGTRPLTFNAELHAEFFDPIFEPSRTVVIDGRQTDYAKERYQLPSGHYEVNSRDGVVSIQPLFPAQQLTKVLDFTTGALVTASAILIGSAILSSTTSDNSNNSNGGNDMGPSITVWSLTGLSALSDILLHVQKARFLKSYSDTAVPVQGSASDAEQSYQKAQNLLVAGDLSGASALYVHIIRNNTDSLYYPRALYQLAKIHAIEGDDLLATAELRIILDKYPLPDLYDKTCKSLADINYRAGNYRAALDYLSKMVFLDPLFPRAQIDEYRSQIEKKQTSSGASA